MNKNLIPPTEWLAYHTGLSALSSWTLGRLLIQLDFCWMSFPYSLSFSPCFLCLSTVLSNQKNSKSPNWRYMVFLGQQQYGLEECVNNLLLNVQTYCATKSAVKKLTSSDVQLIINFSHVSHATVHVNIMSISEKKTIFSLPNLSLCRHMRWENILNHWWTLLLQSSISHHSPLLIYYLYCMCEK